MICDVAPKFETELKKRRTSVSEYIKDNLMLLRKYKSNRIYRDEK